MLTYVLFCSNLSSLDRDYQTIETEFESRVKTLRYPNLTQCDYIQNQLNQNTCYRITKKYAKTIRRQ